MRQGLDARPVISWVQEMKTEYDGTEEKRFSITVCRVQTKTLRFGGAF
jgi:hypothetical protein